MSKWQQYIDYINKVGKHPLPTAIFDDDHEPAGQMIRDTLVKAMIIKVAADGIHLRPDLIRRRNP